jgi:hypothetical protein
MSGRSPRAVIGAAVMGIAVAAAVTVVVASSRPMPPAPPKFPKPPEAHPVIPPEASDEQPAPRPPSAFCEARDIAMVATSLREAHKRAFPAAKAGDKKGAPPACREGDHDRALAIAFDGLTKRTGACTARDSELDSQWNQLDSAVLDYGRCIDCTHPRDDRLNGCQRMLDQITSAEKSMR